MTLHKDIIVAIKLLPISSDEVSGVWQQDFNSALKKCLYKDGLQTENCEDLLLLRFKKLSTAYLTVFGCFKQIKQEHNWNFSGGKLPAQIIFDNPIQYTDRLDAIYTSEATIWDGLETEVLHVTFPLKSNWYKLLDDIDLPSHLFEKTANNLFQVHFSCKSLPPEEQLFPYRDLPVQGKMPQCFYCGMKSHSPAQCPAKQLPAKLTGIQDIGYLSVAEISKCYKTVFSDLKKYTDIIAAGVSYSQTRKDPTLLTLITYFDLSMIYQPRFLWKLAASTSSSWKISFSSFKFLKDNRNLALGLDCLRVSKFNQAKKMFEKEALKPFGGQYFYATVAQSFIALETGEIDDMRYYLSRAKTLAGNEKERVYVALLSAKLEVLNSNFDSASSILSGLLGIIKECLDVKYIQLQLEANLGATEETLKKMGNLVEEHTTYFIMLLLDPMLLPTQGFVDEILADILKEKAQTAQERLTKVSETRESLMVWAEITDKDLQTNLQALEEMGKKFNHNSFFDYRDVTEKCNALSFWFKKIQTKQLNKMIQEINELTVEYNKLYQYWTDYSYKSYFKAFHEQLKALSKDLSNVTSLVESTEGEELRKAYDLLATIRNEFGKLVEISRKMSRLEIAVKGLLIFGKNLLILEAVFIVTGLILLSASNLVEPESVLYRAPIRRIMTLTTILLAPLLAFCTTLLKVYNK